MATPWLLYPKTQGYTVGHGGNHDGWDFGAPKHTPLISLTGGKVTGHTGFYKWGGEIDTKGGILGSGVTETFAHADRIDVRPNQIIAPGQQVGLSGGENLPREYSTGEHIHYSLFGGAPWDNTKSIDPSNVINAARTGGIGSGPSFGVGSILGSTGDAVGDAITSAYNAGAAAAGAMVKRIGWYVLGLFLILLGLWLLYSKTMSAVAYRAANDAAPVLGKAAKAAAL